MPEGAFRVYPSKTVAGEVDFEIAAGFVADVPEDQAALRDAVDHCSQILRAIYATRPEAELRAAVDPLIRLAQAGLTGAAANPSVAARALTSFKADIVLRESARVKNAYLRKLGKPAAAVAALSLASAAVTGPLAAAGVSSPTYGLIASSTLARVFLLLGGCAAGTWVSFGVRNTVMQFADLGAPEADRLDPAMRLAFVSLLTGALALLLHLKALEIKLGGLDASQVFRSGETALMVGFLCGFSEKALSAKVAAHAGKLLA